MSNGAFEGATLLVLAIQVVALIMAVALRRSWPGLVVNLAFAGATLIALALNSHGGDPAILALGVFEALAAATAGLALWRRYRAAVVASWVVFTLHLLASTAAALFAFTFRISRLI